MNGWQRLWAVACFLLACYAVIENIKGIQRVWEYDRAHAQFLSIRLFGIWIAVCIGIYASGWLVAWVIRGFRPKAT